MDVSMKSFYEKAQKFPENDVSPEEMDAGEALSKSWNEESLMKALQENSVVIIHQSDKTIQVPKFLYERGYNENNKLIGITEPNKLAAATVAAKVTTEIALPGTVACLVGYECEENEKTRIKIMTDGVLLKDFKEDPDLTKYSVIIIDEAQERFFISDILIGLLSYIVQRRKKINDPLKIIIMSTIMNLQDFIENPVLFKEPPVLIQIPSQQYKVEVQHCHYTPCFNSVEEAYREVCKIHSLLPAGGILVFLAHEEEVAQLCKMLQFQCDFKEYLNYYWEQNYCSEQQRLDNSNLNPKTDSGNNSRNNKKKQMQNDNFNFPENKKDLDVSPLFDDAANIKEQFSDDVKVCNANENDCKYSLYTLPLHSNLSIEEQVKVYQHLPCNTRLCVVSTNIAETTIPIPGIKYVIDSGKIKTRMRNAPEGVPRFGIEWTSKASANRRTSCAGYKEGGHCIRLYSQSVFEHHFPECSHPEIQRVPADCIVLQLKNLGIADVINYPFPSPPDKDVLKVAERKLVCLRALEVLKMKSPNKNNASTTIITPYGRPMINFSISPRYTKILMLSHMLRCVPHISAIVSAMSVYDVFLTTVQNKQHETEETDVNVNLLKDILCNVIKNIGSRSGKSLEFGDAMVMLRAVALFEESKNKVQFCTKSGLNCNAMIQIRKVRQYLHSKLQHIYQDISLPEKLTIEPPNDKQIELFQKILTAGFTDHVARLLTEEETQRSYELKNAYQCLDINEAVFIHPDSVLFSKSPSYIIYQEIVHTSKYYMKGVVEIKPEWLPELAPDLCEYSDPLEEPAPIYDSEDDTILCSFIVKYGPWCWEVSTITDKMPEGILKYRWFSIFLLDGQVYNFFKHYRSHLLLPSSCILNLCATALPHVNFLGHLYHERISSRESLKQKWEEDSKYLLKEYLEWLPFEKHLEVEHHWPPVS